MAKDYPFYLQYTYKLSDAPGSQNPFIKLSLGNGLSFWEKIETTSGALLDVKLPNDPVVGLS